MKKIAIFLAVIMLFCSVSVTVFAKDNIPVSAEIIETESGDFHVTVYAQSPRKLVSFITVIEYDVTLYSLSEGYASTSEASDGETVENFSGAWVFGSLADKTGCAGAFISYSGASKNGRVAACEFIIHPETIRKSADDIKVYVKEYVTDDNDEENDIYKKTPVSVTEDNGAASDKFEFLTGETVTITEIKSDDKILFIPEIINGLTVRALVTDKGTENPFVVFGRNVLRVEKGVFSPESTVISPVGSAPESSAKLVNGKYFSYSEGVTVDLKKPVFYTADYLVTDDNTLFSGNCQYSVEASHKLLEYWGTGTSITLENGDSEGEFYLCVMGDVNGDSVCDVLDVMLCEEYVSGNESLGEIEIKSTEFTADSVVDVQDYAQLVNLALEQDYSVFEGVRGDLNGDYAVDVLDLLAFNRLSQNPRLTVEEKAMLDFNNDGKINSSDALVLELLIESFQ